MSTALIIVGHGSTLNPDSSTPTHAHADEIRRRGIFDEVWCAFWKEEPSMREILYMVESSTVFIVPNFISEGYFTREVLPRELQLEGPVTQIRGKTVYYCDPVGIHRGMTRLLLKRADQVAANVPRDQTTLIIVGHGTSLNEQSRKAIESQVEFIREGRHGFAEVLDAYMEEAPFVAKWHEMSNARNVVVVPFFIADGLHSYQDIPVLLGLEAAPTVAASQNDVFRHNPHELHGRSLYYSSAIGTEELMADVILDQVEDCRNRHGLPSMTPSGSIEHPLSRSEFTIGQIRISPLHDGSWAMHHVEDTQKTAALTLFYSPIDARAISLYDDSGGFRKLKTAPSLRHGWRLELGSDDDLALALNFFYPAALGLWRHWQNRSLNPVHLRETLGRQTGMYRFSNAISDEQAQRMIVCECDPETHCLRRITWRLNSEQPLAELPPEKLPPDKFSEDSVPLICVEACTHVVSVARELARKAAGGTASTSAP